MDGNLVDMDPTSIEAKFDDTANFANQLTNIKENHKFQKDNSESDTDEDLRTGFRQIIAEIKDQFALKYKQYVYMWHATVGYWGGVKPGVAEMEQCEHKISLHPMAEYHGAARSVGGCPIYVSDKPGNHDLDVLKKLVVPDGSTLKAKFPGRPTIDCLFSDPTRDGKSLLKIWNINDFTGVQVFNCQGASWCRDSRKNLIHDKHPETISDIIRATDAHYITSIAENGWSGDCIMYSHRNRKLVYVPENASLPIQLKAREYEIFTVVPVKKLSNVAAFNAPIGLIKMFNSGGAVQELNFESTKIGNVDITVRGCGIFGAFSSVRPKRTVTDMNEEEFDYEENSGLITLDLKTSREC